MKTVKDVCERLVAAAKEISCINPNTNDATNDATENAEYANTTENAPNCLRPSEIAQLKSQLRGSSTVFQEIASAMTKFQVGNVWYFWTPYIQDKEQQNHPN